MDLKDASVVICTHDAGPRLRLVLRALSVQEVPPEEVIVVDDVSLDDTTSILEEAASWFRDGLLQTVRLEQNAGSPGARNAGARLATRDLLVFLDADALPTRAHVKVHLDTQRRRGPVGLLGPLWHTTTTEYLRDPATGETFDVAIPDEVRTRLERDLPGQLVTEADVLERFDSIVARSRRGSYPHLDKMEREGERLGDATNHAAAWILMSPQNFSVPRSCFERVGGFDESLPFCEGWDLVLRLASAGVPALRTPDAPIYHLYHHRALDHFREPLRRYRAMKRIAEKMRHPALLLANLYFHFTGGDPWLPKELGLDNLDRLAEVFAAFKTDDLGPYGVVLRGHPLFADLEQAALLHSGVQHHSAVPGVA